MVAELFERIPQKYKWKQEDIKALNEVQTITLLNTFTNQARKLDASKLLSKPITDIKMLTGYVPLNERPEIDRLVVYQNHDT